MYSTPFERNGWKPRQAGFSLIELLIVVAILMIMGLIVLPSASQDGSTPLRMAARRLVSDLEYAQLQSIGNGEDPCLVVFKTDESSYYLARRSAPDTPIMDPATQTPYLIQFGQGAVTNLNGVGIDSINLGGGSQLQFDSGGTLSGGPNAAITLRCGEALIQIQVNADTGEPSVP